MTDWKQETKQIESELNKLRNLGLDDRQPRLSDEQIRFALTFHGKLVEKVAQLERENAELRKDKAHLLERIDRAIKHLPDNPRMAKICLTEIVHGDKE